MARKMGKKLQTEVSSESGMIDIFILVVSFTYYFFLVSGNVLLHYQVVDAHIENSRRNINRGIGGSYPLLR